MRKEKKVNQSSLKIKIYTIGLNLISLVVYAIIFIVIPMYGPMFDEYGVELPSLTRFALSWYWLFCFFQLLGLISGGLLICGKSLFNMSNRILFGLVIFSFVLSWFILFFLFYCMYLPIEVIGIVASAL